MALKQRNGEEVREKKGNQWPPTLFAVPRLESCPVSTGRNLVRSGYHRNLNTWPALRPYMVISVGWG